MSSRGIRKARWIFVAALVLGCGGAPPPPPEEPPPPEPDPVDEVEQPELKQAEKSEGDPEEKPEGKAPVAEPEFKEGASVQEAINAVPQGTSRINLDSETLAGPLTDPKVYDSCKLAPNQHFKLKVAIWQGKAVGVDVEAQPPNKKVVECIDKVVRGITWEDKVPSLNTVEYSL